MDTEFSPEAQKLVGTTAKWSRYDDEPAAIYAMRLLAESAWAASDVLHKIGTELFDLHTMIDNRITAARERS